MKKSIMRICISGFAVVVAVLLAGCEDPPSLHNEELVDGFLIRVNQDPGSSGGGSGSYQVVVNSDGVGATGGGANVAGERVTIYAGTMSAPHWFEKWMATPSVRFDNDTNATTSFIMPASRVTVTANFWTFSGWGSFTDTRGGGKTYKTTTIKGKKWMAENLNYTPSSGNSWCYGNSAESCNIYGRLYDWETAKTVCPTGWHLPTRQEWGDLAILAGGTGGYGDGGQGGKILKATSGWNGNGNGTDEMGFSALPGGYRFDAGSFYGPGNYGYWWTATELGSGYAYGRGIDFGYDNLDEDHYVESNGYSVRCLQDD